MQVLLAAIVWPLITTVGGSFAGAWFGAYLKKKGENYAIHQDLNKLIKQMEAVTKATEEVKAEISDKVWNRQRQWEFKRDILLEAAKGLGACNESFLQLEIAYKAGGKTSDMMQNQIARSREWNAAASQFATSTRLLIDLVCGVECRTTFSHFGEVSRGIAEEIRDGDVDAFMKSAKEYRGAYARACNAIRKELGIEAEELGVG